MTALDTVLIQAEQVCQQNHTRLTAKRKVILSALVESGQALSAYELIDYCQKHFAQCFPAMTVYRILDFLTQQNLVYKLEIANRFVACQHFHGQPERFQYMYCARCKRANLIELPQALFDEIQSQLSGQGLNLVQPHIELSCLCLDCQREEMY